MNGMKHYLICTNFEGRTEFTAFWADDIDHAMEQLENESDEYNAEQYVTHVFVSDTEIENNATKRDTTGTTAEIIANLKVGDKVWWTDPDNGFSSGFYDVMEIQTEDGKLEYDDDIVLIGNGSSTAQVFPWELSFTQL